jgi:hypothetical protein
MRVQGQGLGWINIGDSIIGSRNCAKGMDDNDDDDGDTINDSGGTEIPQHR